MPQETKAGGVGGGATAEKEPSLFGWNVDLSDAPVAMDALEKAFDYRGDVTLRLRTGEEVGGYIFDRRKGPSLGDSYVRIMPPTGEKLKVPYSDIARLEFSGKDAAHGKSFESWIKKYVDKKMKGETASIESEKLD